MMDWIWNLVLDRPSPVDITAMKWMCTMDIVTGLLYQCGSNFIGRIICRTDVKIFADTIAAL